MSSYNNKKKLLYQTIALRQVIDNHFPNNKKTTKWSYNNSSNGNSTISKLNAKSKSKTKTVNVHVSNRQIQVGDDVKTSNKKKYVINFKNIKKKKKKKK